MSTTRRHPHIARLPVARLGLVSLPLSLAAALLLATPASAAEYRLDPARSTLVVRIWKEGSLSAFAHDHVVRAPDVQGTVRWDPQHPNDASVVAEAATQRLVNDEPPLRKRFGLPVMSEKDRRVVRNTMLGPEQLDVANHPKVAFRSTRVAHSGASLVVTGTLDLHGRQREVSFPAVVELRQGKLHATASFRFRQSDFGIEPYRFGNAVRNQDEVEMVLELIGDRVP